MFRQLLFRLTSRAAIMAMSSAIILLMLQGSWDILRKYGAIALNQPAMENILQGLSTILVAYGLVLQERAALLTFLKLYPHGITAHQSRVDAHCSGYGLAVILVGMFVSVAVYLIRMPDLDIASFDPAIIVLGALFCLVAAGLLARLCWLLWRDPKEA
jgi:hypothetical protein